MRKPLIPILPFALALPAAAAASPEPPPPGTPPSLTGLEMTARTILSITAGRYRAFFTSHNDLGRSPEASIGFRVVRPKS